MNAYLLGLLADLAPPSTWERITDGSPPVALIVAGVLGGLVLLLVVFVSMRPSDFSVVRMGKIAAPPSAVFAEVNDFHRWEEWSPWAKLDPDCKVGYEGPSAGPGAIFWWDGNKKVGAGKMTILDSKPNDLIRIKLEFFRPFKATNTTEFTFQPEADQTVVKWNMFGKNNFMGKLFSLIMDCDKMVGPDFERGLASMKSIVESKKA